MTEGMRKVVVRFADGSKKTMEWPRRLCTSHAVTSHPKRMQNIHIKVEKIMPDGTYHYLQNPDKPEGEILDPRSAPAGS